MKIDFGSLKEIPFAEILNRYGVKFRQPNKEYLRADCPLPSHASKESKGSFAVNINLNIWCCKSHSCNESAGRKGGDVLDFVALMEGTKVATAAQKLVEWFPQGGQKNRASTEEAPKGGATDLPKKSVLQPHSNPVSEKNKPLSFELKGISYHPYLKERGVSEEQAKQFGIGFFPGKGSMAGRIVIPIKNGAGELLAYAGRALNGDEPRYKLPAGFHKGQVLWNLHNVKGDTCVIAEGFFGAIRVIEAGFPCVALIGSTLSPEQEKLLKFKFLTLLLDPDDAGRAGVNDMLPRLALKHYVRVARNDKPPDQMTIDEIKNCLRYTCPI